MKKLLFLLLALVLFIPVSAQTSSDSIKEAYSKIKLLEDRLTLQDTRIAKLMQQVDEVTRQNLSLKKNLNLTPTISRAKAGEVMEYRIIEVTGDSITNTVHMTIIADNISLGDASILYDYYQLVDDKGRGYDNSFTKDRFVLKVVGEYESESLMKHFLNHHPKAPYTIDAYIYEITPEVQYIKYLWFKIYDATNSKHYEFYFENLPIKWTASVEQ